MKTEARFSKLPAVIAFIFIIAVPLANNILHIRPGSSRPGERKKVRAENHVTDSLSSFFRKLGHNFEKSFFSRLTLNRINNSLKYRIFGVSGVAKVIIGRQGWLFQARVNEVPGTAGYFPSIKPFSPEELDQWGKSLQERQHWLKNKGSEYLFIPVPDKSSIYPEYLPENLRAFYRRSRLDQLIKFLKTNTDIPILDVRPALLEAKTRFPVYAKTDSHWNELGACIVSGEIHKYFSDRFANAKRFTLSDFRMKMGRKRSGGNLAVMLALENSLFREERIKISPNVPFRAVKAELPPVRFSSTVAAEASGNQSAPFANIVFFHDSFGRQLKPFLSEYFSRIVYIRDWGFRFKTEVIEKERPIIVLDEIAEHFLYNLKLANDRITKNGI